MLGFALGVVTFIVVIFSFSYMQTIKRCRMFYYLEIIEYALKNSSDSKLNQGMIDSANHTAKTFKLSSQPSISEEMDYCVKSRFNDNKAEFMNYVRSLGYKG